MGAARYSPWEFVLYLHSLQTTAGPIPLKQYMAKTAKNGGNDSTTSLFKNMRWFHEGGVKGAPILDDIVGTRNMELALKGQGSGDTFIKIWNFMFRNKEQLKKYDVDIFARRKKGDSQTKVFLKTVKIYNEYFRDYSNQGAIELMIADRFFGIDCIGFTGQFLVYTGEWTSYIGLEPDLWPRDICKENIKNAKDVRALDFLVWVKGGHIAIIDEVFDMVDERTVRVDICQCTSGEVVGPQLYQWVQLRETDVPDSSKRRQFKIQHKGSPAMPVDGNVYIMRKDGLFW